MVTSRRAAARTLCPVKRAAALAACAAIGLASCADGDGNLTPVDAGFVDADGGDVAVADAGADADGGDDAGATPVTGPNPYLADSAWPTSHGSPLAQGSSDLPGPTHPDGVVEFLDTGLVSITLAYGPLSDDGEQVVWGSSPGAVFKLLRTETKLEIADRVELDGGFDNLIAGAYTLLDRDGVFFRTVGADIEAWVDDPSDQASPIALRDRWTFEGDTDVSIIGLGLTWDGWLVFATSDAHVGVMQRDFSGVQIVSLGDDEAVSNSIAVDETGGIFVVTDAALYRAQWTGDRLSTDEVDGAWRANYATGSDDQTAGRLGTGSGSTPSLMGAPGDPDRFVVITDGQELMHLALFWREAIPDGAVPPSPDADPRLAAEIAVTFGNPDETASVSEQSVLVSGYRAVVVSNKYAPSSVPIAPVLAGEAPLGVEQFAWDPATGTLRTTWVRDDVSCPNGIPTMSRATDTMYCLGRQGETWTIEAFDWSTGATNFRVPLGNTRQYNSTYAATEIGPDGEIITGTFAGLVRYRVAGVPAPAGCRDVATPPYPASSPYRGVHAGPANNDLVPCDTAGRFATTWHALPDVIIAQPNTFSPDGATTYVTTSQPEGVACSVWALDAATGDVRWCVAEPGAIGSSVEVDAAGDLYLAADAGMVSWTPDGVERWRAAFGEGASAVGLHLHPSGAVATVTTTGRALLVDAATGDELAALDLYAALGLVAPAAGGGLGLADVLPAEVREDFARVLGGVDALLDVFTGTGGAYTDNTVAIAPDGTLYAIGAGRDADNGAVVQVRFVDGALVPGWQMPIVAGSASSPAISPDGRWLRVSDGNRRTSVLAPSADDARVLVVDIGACDANEDDDEAPDVCAPAFTVPLATGPMVGAAPVLDDAEHYYWEAQLAGLFDNTHADLVRMSGEDVVWATDLPDDALWTSVLTLTDRHILGTLSTVEPSDRNLLGIPLPSTASSALAVVDRATGVLVSSVPVPADSTSTVSVGPDGAVYVTMLGLVHGFALETQIVGGLVRLDPWSAR